MTVDFNETPQDNPMTRETDTPMFAPIPSWERGKKRRTLGARTVKTARVAATVAAEPRSFATRPDTGDLRRARTRTATVVDEPVNEALMSRSLSPARRSNGVSPIALLAGIVVLGGLGAAGWYASQPHETGVAQLTPGQATTTTTTSVAPTQMAANTMAPPTVTPPAAVEPTVTVSRKTTTMTRRAAPARASSVDDASMNTSALLPEAPMPYTGTAVNPAPATDTMTPAPVAPAVTTPAPVDAAPATMTPAIPDATTAAPPEAVVPVITPEAPAATTAP